MDAIEKRARELLAEIARKFGQPEYAYHIGRGGVLDRGDRDLIAPIIAALSLPEGYVLVPVEPTLDMLGEIQLVEHFTGNALRARYAAMLAARPEVT